MHSLLGYTLDQQQQNRELIKVLQNLRLLHGFQISKIDNYGKRSVQEKVCLIKGHLAHEIKQKAMNIEVQKKHRNKRVSIYNSKHSVSKNDINYFFYNYSVYSKNLSRFLNGNRVFFNRDTIDWELLDDCIIKSHFFKDSFRRSSSGLVESSVKQLFNEKVKKDAFCINIVVYEKPQTQTKSSVKINLHQEQQNSAETMALKQKNFIDRLNDSFKDLTEGQRLSQGRSSVIIFTRQIPVPHDILCETDLQDTETDKDRIKSRREKQYFQEEFLHFEVFPGTEDSFLINISWLTANSYMVHYVKMLVTKASEAEKMDCSILNFGLNKFFEIATLEPCLILKNLSEEEIKDKIFKLRRKGFIWVDLNQCDKWNDKIRFEFEFNSRLSRERQVPRHKRVPSNKMDLSESQSVREINSDIEALLRSDKPTEEETRKPELISENSKESCKS